MPHRKQSPSRAAWIPSARYGAGDRDAEALAGHAAQVMEWRRGRAVARETCEAAAVLIASGWTITAACTQVGTTHQALHGRALWDPEWRQRLDDALTAGRPGDVPHGRPWGYRQGCRCPECRRAHHETGPGDA